MRKIFLGLLGIITLVFASPSSAFASANSFHFESFEADYYLSQTKDGRGAMHIEEVLTAVFPNYNQNHGIERCIPKKYNGTSILVNPQFSVLRNGTKEPFTTYNDGKFLCLRIGDANSYVQGEQQYRIAYNVENVVLNPNNSEYQELYWDTNGTGWSQRFESLTARIHIPEELNNARKSQLDKDVSCYVGAYNTSGDKATSRCEVSSGPDYADPEHYATVITLETGKLSAGENLTFDIEFQPSAFFVKGPDADYSLIIIIIVGIIISTLLIIYGVRANNKVKDKKALDKDPATPVQYVPPKGLTVAEAGTVWTKSPKSLQVATLMQLAVTHKVELEKGEKKRFGKGYEWKVHVKNLDGLSAEQNIILEILNGGSSVKVGDVIEVKRHTATSHLQKLGQDFSTKIESSLKGKKLFEPDKGNTGKSGSSSAIGVVTVVIVLTIIFSFSIGFISSALDNISENASLVGFFLFFAHIITLISIASNISKYKKRTLSGIKYSKYIDGLKEYMELAEKDRLKFLQSVEGVDTSHKGIAKLYEKLLPYAVVFGIEDSWLEELNKYYQMDDVDTANWVMAGVLISTSDFHSFTSYTSSSVYSSTASSDSGGSSGGGGGGFSGGGGGGGGGGGW